MVTPELLAFIRGEQAKGVSKESIINLLRTQNWTEADIVEAFNDMSPSQTPMAPHMNESASFSPAMTVTQTRSHKKMLALGAIITILVLIVGGTLAYASGSFVSLENVFSQSIQSSQSAAGSTFDVKVTVDTSGLSGEDNISDLVSGLSDTINLTMKGSYDTHDPQDIKANSSFSFVSGTMEGAIELRVVDGSVYAMLTKAPNLGFFSLKPFENKWIVYPYKAQDGNVISDPLFSQAGIDSQSLSELTDDQKQKLADITRKASFIKVTNKHLPEMVEGVFSYHFEFDLDHQGIIAYIKEMTVYLDSINENSTKLAFTSNIDDKLFDAIKNFHGEAWIGLFDKLPHKLTINTEIKNPDKSQEGLAKISIVSNYTNWNKPITVETPKDTTTIEKLMSSVMGGMFGGELGSTDMMSEPYDSSTSVGSSDPLTAARIKGTIAAVKSTLSSMRAQAELFYDNNGYSYKGFCSSKGQYGADILFKELPSNTTYKCNDSDMSWAAWSQLSTGEYLCVDSTGLSNSVTVLPKGTSCK